MRNDILKLPTQYGLNNIFYFLNFSISHFLNFSLSQPSLRMGSEMVNFVPLPNSLSHLMSPWCRSITFFT